MIVLVIGEVCEDVFIYGNANRLSPEAPVPIFVPKRIIRNSGMAGNVVNNVNCLVVGEKTHLIRQVGLITKTRYVDDKSNHMFMRVDEGDDTVKPYDKEFNTENYSVVIVSDYNKGFLTDDHLLQIGKTCTGISLIDSKRKITQEIIDSFNFVKVNEHEYLNNKEILDKNLEKVIITLGKDGVRYKGNNVPSPSPKETIDVSGAGDTFIASFAVRYFETKDVELSIKFANEMSAIVVSKRGVVTPL
jgi:D-beta-D-heptose 7-phosphate kinase/D-beta-D-heptose 1-phosphate adenosyltransferase